MRPPNGRDGGVPGSSEALLAHVYEDLRRLAASWLQRERPGQTLQATALVHEAYLRLVGDGTDRRWEGRGHFFAAAAQAMRRILVENARRKGRRKHGGAMDRVQVELTDLPATVGPDDLVAIDEALEDLAREAPTKAQVVTMRFFAGMSMEEIADVLSVSRSTVHRDWTYARAWLFRRLRPEVSP